VFDNLPKAFTCVGFAENRDRRTPVLGLEPTRSLTSHKHDAGSEVRPALFDPLVEFLATHPRHSKVSEDHVIAASGKQF